MKYLKTTMLIFKKGKALPYDRQVETIHCQIAIRVKMDGRRVLEILKRFLQPNK